MSAVKSFERSCVGCANDLRSQICVVYVSVMKSNANAYIAMQLVKSVHPPFSFYLLCSRKFLELSHFSEFLYLQKGNAWVSPVSVA